jgi:hypothetical protein
MACGSCGSANQKKFGAEINIHFSGRIHLDDPGILVFPELSVCLDCGFTHFALRERELGVLKQGLVGPTQTHPGITSMLLRQSRRKSNPY